MCDESFFFPELGGKSFLLSSIVFLLLHMWRKENIFSRASADVVLSVIVSLRHSLSTDYTTTHIFFFLEVCYLYHWMYTFLHKKLWWWIDCWDFCSICVCAYINGSESQKNTRASKNAPATSVVFLFRGLPTRLVWYASKQSDITQARTNQIQVVKHLLPPRPGNPDGWMNELSTE